MSEQAPPLLQVSALSKAYPAPRKSLLERATQPVLHDISFDLQAGDSLGLVGESGSGKSTLGRCLVRLIKPSNGSVCFDGTPIGTLNNAEMRPYRSRLQMIFQDPHASLNPRRTIGATLRQALQYRLPSVDSQQIVAALAQVQLPSNLQHRYPHQLSGGQKQRVGIARALAHRPELLIADEVVSGLDVSNQAQIIALLQQLQREAGIALVFISHDLSVVRSLCRRCMVLREGHVVEIGETAALFENPQSPYTLELLQSIPLPVVDSNWLN